MKLISSASRGRLVYLCDGSEAQSFMITASAAGISSKTSWSTTALRRLPHAEWYLAAAFFGSEEAPHEGRNVIRQLEEVSVASPTEFYQALQQFITKLSPGVNASIAAVLCQEKSITVLGFGGGLIEVVHSNGNARWLLDGSSPTQALEGSLQPQDIFILTTASTKSLLPDPRAWDGLHPDDVAADLVRHYHQGENSGELATLVLENTVQHVEFAPTPQKEEALPVQQGRPESSPFLIAPEKIQAGILATEEEHTKNWQRNWRSDVLLKWVDKVRQLSWLKIVLVVALLVVVIGGLLGWRAWRIRQEREAVIVPLEQLVQQVQAYPEDQKLQQRDAAKSLLERLQATRVTNRANQTRLRELTTQVDGLYESISGQKEIVNLPVFYDFRLVASDFLATRGEHFQDQAAFLDANGKKIIGLDLKTKNNQTMSSDDLEDGKDLVVQDGAATVLRAAQVEKFPLSGASTSKITDISMDDPRFLEQFGDNLYVFAQGDQQLWRLNTAAENASPSAWIHSAQGVDLTKITSLSIDGSVWLGSSTGNIYKLTRGEREKFAVEGLLEPFSSTVLVAAQQDENGDKLAVVEPSKNRMIILNKDGTYQQEITSPQLGAVTDAFWEDGGGAVYLVAGSVVYRVEI